MNRAGFAKALRGDQHHRILAGSERNVSRPGKKAVGEEDGWAVTLFLLTVWQMVFEGLGM